MKITNDMNYNNMLGGVNPVQPPVQNNAQGGGNQAATGTAAAPTDVLTLGGGANNLQTPGVDQQIAQYQVAARAASANNAATLPLGQQGAAQLQTPATQNATGVGNQDQNAGGMQQTAQTAYGNQLQMNNLAAQPDAALQSSFSAYA